MSLTEALFPRRFPCRLPGCDAVFATGKARIEHTIGVHAPELVSSHPAPMPADLVDASETRRLLEEMLTAGAARFRLARLLGPGDLQSQARWHITDGRTCAWIEADLCSGCASAYPRAGAVVVGPRAEGAFLGDAGSSPAPRSLWIPGGGR